MYRTFKTVAWAGAACILSVSLACNSTPNAPTAPGGAASDQGANADGSTLKVAAPTLVSPVGDVRLNSRKPTMVSNATTGVYVNRPFSYEFQLMNDGGGVLSSTTVAGSATPTWAFPDDLERDTPYRWRVRATLSGAVGPWSTAGRFFTVKENRTPNPPPGGRLPLPNMGHVVSQVVAQNPGILSASRSCQDPSHGGNPVSGWEFLDKVVDALRLTDTRWGYNGKRGNANDPSQDIVAYNWGTQPDEGTTNVYIIDTLLSHCGSNPAPTWIDQTGITLASGTIGRWTSRGRFPGSQGAQ